VLEISIHHSSPEYQEKIWPVRELVSRWERAYGTLGQYSESYRNWTRRYRGHGDAMEPFEDNRPRDSWLVCPAKWCKQLHEGRLWKCAPLAYLPMQALKYRMSEWWNQYLKYRPLEPHCSDDELDRFLALEDESYCAMCSAYPRHFDLPSPLVRPKLSAGRGGTAPRKRQPLLILTESMPVVLPPRQTTVATVGTCLTPCSPASDRSRGRWRRLLGGLLGRVRKLSSAIRVERSRKSS